MEKIAFYSYGRSEAGNRITAVKEVMRRIRNLYWYAEPALHYNKAIICDKSFLIYL